MRGARYAGCIIFKNASVKRAYCFYHFDGFDFRAHAKLSDWVVIWVTLGSNALILVFGVLMLAANGFHIPTQPQ